MAEKNVYSKYTPYLSLTRYRENKCFTAFWLQIDYLQYYTDNLQHLYLPWTATVSYGLEMKLDKIIILNFIILHPTENVGWHRMKFKIWHVYRLQQA